MNQMLNTSWGRNVIAALLAAILFALLGLLLGTPPAVSLFAAAIFAALLVLIVQLGLVISILASTRGTASDMGASMEAELATPAGQQELRRMDFLSLLSVAVVQELHVTLFRRDQPLWALEFLGIGEGRSIGRDYGWLNRYLEWMLMALLGAFAGIAAILIAWFVYALAAPESAQGLSLSGLACSTPAFFLGLLLALPVGMFVVSVIRRMFILYAMRADESRIR